MIDKAYLEARVNDLKNDMEKTSQQLQILQGMYFECNNNLIKLQDAEKAQNESKNQDEAIPTAGPFENSLG